MTIRSKLAWPFRQSWAFVRGVWMFIRTTKLDDVIPPGIKDVVNWFLGLFPRALGLRGTSPTSQIRASIALAIFTVLSIIFTPVAWIWVGTAVFGLLRFFPWLNNAWLSLTGALPINRDYNIPFWRSE